MPSSSVLMFTDPDEYARPLQQGPVDLTIMRPAYFTATLCTVNCGTWRCSAFRKNCPRRPMSIAAASALSSQFRTEAGPPVIRNGVELSTARLRG